MDTANDVKLLNEIFQNARIGVNAIDIILGKTRDMDLLGDLTEQREKYLDIAKRAAGELIERDALPEDVCLLAKGALWTSLQTATLFNSAPERLAQLVINGSRNGIGEIEELLKGSGETQQDALDLANALIALERDSVTRMESYVS